MILLSSHLTSSRMFWTQVKRGADLSTNHHLVLSWIRKSGRPKPIVRVCWELMAEPSAREVFNSHIQKIFSQIPREAGDIESKWTTFSASITDVAALSCGSNFFGARHGGKFYTWWVIIVMDIISRCSRELDGVQFGPCTGVVYGQCEAAGKTNSASKSQATVLAQKRGVCPLQVDRAVLPQVK